MHKRPHVSFLKVTKELTYFVLEPTAKFVKIRVFSEYVQHYYLT
jgi:hypothetical protein